MPRKKYERNIEELHAERLAKYRTATILNVETHNNIHIFHIPVVSVQRDKHIDYPVNMFRCPCCGFLHTHGISDGIRTPHCPGWARPSPYKNLYFNWYLNKVYGDDVHLAGDLDDWQLYVLSRSEEEQKIKQRIDFLTWTDRMVRHG